MQLETPLETVIETARLASRAGVRLILNPAPARKLPVELLKMVTILTPNESEAETLTGIKVKDRASATKAARCLLNQGIPMVIITLGSSGALVATGSLNQFIPGVRVKAIDCTAAGDVFNGALAVAVSEGKALLEAAGFANAAAAISVTRAGAQPSAPHRKEIERLLRRRVS
jgi:ribokinase